MSNYYDHELERVLDEEYLSIKIQGVANKTKWLNLNDECIEKVEKFLSKLKERRNARRKDSS